MGSRITVAGRLERLVLPARVLQTTIFLDPAAPGRLQTHSQLSTLNTDSQNENHIEIGVLVGSRIGVAGSVGARRRAPGGH